MVLFKLALDKKYHSTHGQCWAHLSRKWSNTSEISIVQLFVILVVAWMWWLMSRSESEEWKLAAARGRQQRDGQCTGEKEEVGRGHCWSTGEPSPSSCSGYRTLISFKPQSNEGWQPPTTALGINSDQPKPSKAIPLLLKIVQEWGCGSDLWDRKQSEPVREEKGFWQGPTPRWRQLTKRLACVSALNMII